MLVNNPKVSSFAAIVERGRITSLLALDSLPSACAARYLRFVCRSFTFHRPSVVQIVAHK